MTVNMKNERVATERGKKSPLTYQLKYNKDAVCSPLKNRRPNYSKDHTKNDQTSIVPKAPRWH
jgi:hypothetical protein